MENELLKHKFRMLLMDDGEDFGLEVLVSILEEKCAEIAEQYANEKVKEVIDLVHDCTNTEGVICMATLKEMLIN